MRGGVHTSSESLRALLCRLESCDLNSDDEFDALEILYHSCLFHGNRLLVGEDPLLRTVGSRMTSSSNTFVLSFCSRILLQFVRDDQLDLDVSFTERVTGLALHVFLSGPQTLDALASSIELMYWLCLHENCCSIIRDREVVDRLKSIPSKFPLDGNISRIVDLVVDRIESHVLDSTNHLLLQHKEHIYGLTGSTLKSVLGPLSPSSSAQLTAVRDRKNSIRSLEAAALESGARLERINKAFSASCESDLGNSLPAELRLMENSAIDSASMTTLNVCCGLEQSHVRDAQSPMQVSRDVSLICNDARNAFERELNIETLAAQDSSIVPLSTQVEDLHPLPPSQSTSLSVSPSVSVSSMSSSPSLHDSLPISPLDSPTSSVGLDGEVVFSLCELQVGGSVVKEVDNGINNERSPQVIEPIVQMLPTSSTSILPDIDDVVLYELPDDDDGLDQLVSDTESPSVSPIQKDTSGDNRMHSSPISPPSPKKGSIADPIDGDHPCELLSTDAVENLDAMSRKVQMKPSDALSPSRSGFGLSAAMELDDSTSFIPYEIEEINSQIPNSSDTQPFSLSLPLDDTKIPLDEHLQHDLTSAVQNFETISFHHESSSSTNSLTQFTENGIPTEEGTLMHSSGNSLMDVRQRLQQKLRDRSRRKSEKKDHTPLLQSLDFSQGPKSES